ncbi:hypothetical protein [Egbenema bharatensis]|uniref:hypothetical protein n=1 Tax=Egbenema bharatensis TaxID=3463334 RepID=UPI003A83630C
MDAGADKVRGTCCHRRTGHRSKPPTWESRYQVNRNSASRHEEYQSFVIALKTQMPWTSFQLPQGSLPVHNNTGGCYDTV